MNLPADIARCAGVEYEGEWREGCEHCLRRTDRSAVRVWMEPPPIIAFFCEALIEPEHPGGNPRREAASG